MPRSFFILAMAGALALLASPAPATLQAQSLVARAIPVAGEPFLAEFAGLDSRQNLKWRVGGKLRVMPAAELARWGLWNDVETGPQILLASGGILRADALKLDATNLVVGDAADLGNILWAESTLPIEAVAGIVWQPPADALARDRLRFKLLALPAGDDHLLLLGGETIRGTLLEIPRAGRFADPNRPATAADEVFLLQTRAADQPLTIAADKVLAIRWGAATVLPPPAGQAFATIGFRDGSYVVTKKLETRGDAFFVQLPGGGELAANQAFGDGSGEWFWKQVSLLQPASERITYVSDLETLGYKHIPFLSGAWKHGRDQNVLGGHLRQDGEVVLKGLGMFPASRLAYALGGKYRKLQGRLAVDRHAAQEGSVVFRVLTETKGTWVPSYESPIIRGGDAPVEFTVDVQDAERLALLVEYGDRGDASDYANWLDLRLVK